MAKANKKIFEMYCNFMNESMVNRYGVLCPNTPDLRNTWRQTMAYRSDVEEFIIQQTDRFLDSLPYGVQGDYNTIYLACIDMADWVAEYMIKRSIRVSSKDAADKVMDKVLLNNRVRVARFQDTRGRKVNLSNKKWCISNPGVLAMYKAINHIH